MKDSAASPSSRLVSPASGNAVTVWSVLLGEKVQCNLDFKYFYCLIACFFNKEQPSFWYQTGSEQFDTKTSSETLRPVGSIRGQIDFWTLEWCQANAATHESMLINKRNRASWRLRTKAYVTAQMASSVTAPPPSSLTGPDWICPQFFSLSFFFLSPYNMSDLYFWGKTRRN